MMEEEMIKGFLNGVPFKEFIVLYAWALIGLALSFGYSVNKAQRNDPATPIKFSFKHFWKGVKRTLFTMIVMGVGIIFWDEISKILFNSSDSVELTMWSAFFIIGIGSDKLTKTLFGGAADVITVRKNIIKKRLTEVHNGDI